MNFIHNRVFTGSSLRAAALATLCFWSCWSGRAQGTGLTGKYYDGSVFTNPLTTRTDATINFNWGTNAPSGTAITNGDTFSVAWTGQIEPQFTELYTFYLTADDAGRLWVDDQMLVGRTFYTANAEMRGQIRLKAGHRVNLRVEFFESAGNASVKLEWASPSRPREVVPQARLYPTTETPNGGSILRELWTGLTGATFSALTNSANYPAKPASREGLTSFECLATNWEDNFGTRVTGFIRVPTNGNYTFAVSGDDVVQLFLSTNTSASGKVLIASVTNATGFREWTNQPGQISGPIALAAGQRCYVELLHKESTGADYWSVGWMKPGDTGFSVIPGTVLMLPNTEASKPSSSSLFNTLVTEHPYLGVSRERFTWLKQMWQSTNSSGAKSRAQAVINTANSDLTAALDSGRWGQDRIERLALAWWLTGNSNYAERVWENVNYAITNGDWTDPWKGLTDGYVAIGYDWLFPYWSQARKDAMVNKMVSCFSAGWTTSYNNNIGVLLNSGHLMATLAVGMANEAAAEPKLSSALGRLEGLVVNWNANAGAWYEGTDYGILTKWDFGQAMPALEMALGSTWSVARTPGVSMAAREPLFIASNTRHRFTFSDVGTGSEVAIGWANWFARRFNATEVFDFSRLVGNSALNALTVPETTISPGAAGLKPDTAYRGPSDASPAYNQEVFTFREKWDDANALWVGGMGGADGTLSHDMMQSGTFQLVARNKRWFWDLSSESYDVPAHNTHTPNPNGRDRWDYYRNRAEAHNTLVINPNSGPDRVYNSSTRAVIRDFQSAPNGQRSFAVIDLTPKISGATRVHRGFQLLNNRKHLLVQDEIVMAGASVVWWFAHFQSTSTSASISPDGTSVMLQQGSERLWCKILSGGGTWTIRAAEPLPTTPNPPENSPNPSYSKLTINLTGVTSTTLAVWFVPLAPGEVEPVTTPTITALSTWNLVAQNEPPVARNSAATSTSNAPVDVELRNLVSDDWTYLEFMTFAVMNAQGGTVTLLPDGHTARFTLLTNFTGDVSFDFTATDQDALTSAPATVTIGVTPVTYVWTNLVSGNWSVGTNWNNGVAPLSSHGTRIEFFTGSTLSNLTLSSTNNVANPLLLNSLTLAGSGTNGNVITLTGSPLTLVPNGLTPPSVTLAAFTGPVSYVVSNALTLADETTFFANNSGTFNFAGPISGPGGLTRSNTYSTLTLSGNNTYTGPTTISAGTLRIGNDGLSGTLGSGAVVNNGQLRIDRAGTLAVPNDISGTGSLLLHCPTMNDIVELTGDNSFTGEARITGGSLRVTDAAQLGTGTKNIVVDNANGALRLNGSAGEVALPESFRLFTSNPNGALINEAGNNVIEGPVTLSSGAGSSRFTVSGGSLAINGTVTPNATGRTLDLRGAGAGIINGNIVDATAPNTLAGLSKADDGSWTLNGSNAYTGPTTVSGGSLAINGSLSSSSLVTVATVGRLAGNGVIAANTAVLGQLAPGGTFGALTFASNLTFGSASRLQWELGGNSFASADLVTASTVNVTNSAKVDVLLNSPGSTVNLLHAFWRTNRVFGVLNATALGGTFAFGTNSTDAGGRPAATYGSFSLSNSATGVSLRWTALPGFPVINDPIVTITTPATNPSIFTLGVLPLTLAATVHSGGGTNLGVKWTYVSDAGSATFVNAAATNTTVEFSDEGEYRLRCTVTNEVGFASAELTVFVTTAPTWYETRIAFTNYSRAEPLTNFPVLVVLGTNVPGFNYRQFQTPDGSDLRFLGADGETELNHEIETWNTNGSSFVWVQVPLFTNQGSILARWGDPAATDPPVGAGTGAAWSEDFLGVWHLAETAGAHYDSSPALAASRFVSASQQGTAAGIVGGADDFNGTSNYVSLPDLGAVPSVTVEAWVNLNGTPSGGDIGLVSSDPWSAGVTHFKTSSTRNLKAQINGSGTVLSADGVLPVGAWAHIAYTVGGSGAADFRLFLNGALLATAAGTANNILTDVNLAREYNGRYLNARMDEVRISSVARSSNWLWATWQNIASNRTFNSFSPVVPPGNTPPVLAPVADRFVFAGATLVLTNLASDDDVPAQLLTFSLINAPADASLDALTGVFAWTPAAAQAGTTQTCTVVVADNGFPSLSSTQSFLITVLAPPVPVTLVVARSLWRYRDDGVDLGTGWRSNSFNDAAWNSGPARLGFGGDGEVTLLNRTNASGTTNITFYFRRGFYIPNPAEVFSLAARMTRDDGAVVYLNGAEVWRDTMPTGAVSHTTFASAAIGTTNETNWLTKTLDPTGLVAGWNTLAAEVHQSALTSSDIGFDFELTAVVAAPAPATLSIAAGATGLTLAWPAEGFFVVYSATNLASPVVWTRATNEPVLTNGLWTLPLQGATNGQRFYRLQTP
jgi:autotransporter-associated beta strand protein